MLLNLDKRVEVFGEDEDIFTVDMKPLDYTSYQRIMSLYSANVSSDATENAGKMEMAKAFNPMTNPEMKKVTEEVLPTHCENVQGLQVQMNGEIRDLTIEDIITIPQCVMVATMIMTRLIEISTIVDAKRARAKK